MNFSLSLFHFLHSVHLICRKVSLTNYQFSGRTSASTQVAQAKYEHRRVHRRASALLRNVQNIRICMGKKTDRFCNQCVTYENERISIKNSLPYSKCVLRLSCVVYGPIYGCFMGFYVHSFFFIRILFFRPRLNILIFLPILG